MTTKEINKISELLKISSDETRLKIMFALLDETKCQCHHSSCGCCEHHLCMREASVNEIVEVVGESQSLISHQLKTLKDADFVKSRKEGTRVYYSLKDGHIKQLLSVVLEHVMEEK